MTVPNWVSHYIGIPYKLKGRERDGIDCWGLVRLVFRDQLGILLPSYTPDYVDWTDPKVADLIMDGEVGGEWVKIENEQTFDIAEIFVGVKSEDGISMHPLHVALVASPGFLLDTSLKNGTHLRRYRNKTGTLREFWRHKTRV